MAWTISTTRRAPAACLAGAAIATKGARVVIGTAPAASVSSTTRV